METCRLSFEPLQPRHAIELFPVLANEQVYQYFGCRPQASVEEYTKLFQRIVDGPILRREMSWHDFVIRLKATHCLIGRLEGSIGHGWAEIAYQLGPQYWHQGFGMEALDWLQSHLQNVHQVTEFWATVHPQNARSIRLLERAGYQPSELSEEHPLGSYDPGDLVFCLQT